MVKITKNIPDPKAKAGPTAEEQRNMILGMFFDEGNDADGFLALVKHCRIDRRMRWRREGNHERYRGALPACEGPL
jgi:hypothetical protein